MKPALLFSFPEQAELGTSLAKTGAVEPGAWEWRYFPDGESYVRVLAEVGGRNVAILCSLNNPDAKTLPLLFLGQTLKELGAAKVTLIAPYLGYMRQDTRFQPGEAVTADLFAGLLSPMLDRLITIDPHLHRHHRLKEIYTCKGIALTATPLMAQWIKQNVQSPLLIGPDMESEQWVKEVAQAADVPYVILHKERRGDHDVEITLPDLSHHKGRTPVLVDDIISTGGTMIKTTTLLRGQGFESVICLATHGLFAGDAYERLQKAGAATIITANTAPHASNGMNVAEMLAKALGERI